MPKKIFKLKRPREDFTNWTYDIPCSEGKPILRLFRNGKEIKECLKKSSN